MSNPTYKIVSPFLLLGCKTPAMLQKMIDLLPETEHPTEKRPKDMAFGLEWLADFQTAKAMDEAVRKAFNDRVKIKGGGYYYPNCDHLRTSKIQS